MRFHDIIDATDREVAVGRLLIAAYTGRNQVEVARHVAELELLGVPAPPTTPTVYRIEPTLLTQADTVHVDGATTSGEVEAVLVVSDDGMLVTVGSDHTDREIERKDIAASKSACPKVIGRSCLPVSAITDWDRIRLASHIDGATPYQDGRMASVLPLPDILEFLTSEDLGVQPGDVVFLGTIPTVGELRPAGRFTGVLEVPGAPEALTVSYDIRVTHDQGAPA